jgi:hypothetical protein
MQAMAALEARAVAAEAERDALAAVAAELRASHAAELAALRAAHAAELAGLRSAHSAAAQELQERVVQLEVRGCISHPCLVCALIATACMRLGLHHPKTHAADMASAALAGGQCERRQEGSRAGEGEGGGAGECAAAQGGEGAGAAAGRAAAGRGMHVPSYGCLQATAMLCA